MKLDLVVTSIGLGTVAAALLMLVSQSPRAAAASPAPAASGIVYCTAGTSTNGCLANMSCVGVPSASALSGFVLSTSNIEGNKNALMRYSISGRNAAVWGVGSTSFLCVKSPMQQLAPTQNSGGTTNACNGVISVDFLDWAAAHPNALAVPLLAGTTIDVQTIYKDPPAPKTTNLSNGLEFTLVP